MMDAFDTPEKFERLANSSFEKGKVPYSGQPGAKVDDWNLRRLALGIERYNRLVDGVPESRLSRTGPPSGENWMGEGQARARNPAVYDAARSAEANARNRIDAIGGSSARDQEDVVELRRTGSGALGDLRVHHVFEVGDDHTDCHRT